uniref:EF-hand domain-containing protein n=1 Tax=Arion vulgaris TaxID=1028688 RepID=A0A0B7A229_9EUPU
MAKHPIKREELLEAFTMNCSPDNTIPLSKLGAVIRSVGRVPTEHQLHTVCKEFESKGVRTLTFEQVEAIIKKYGFDPESQDALREAFRIFDKDGNGLISAVEIRHILCNLGEKLSDEEVDEMIREADITGDGHINYEEFLKILEAGL